LRQRSLLINHMDPATMGVEISLLLQLAPISRLYSSGYFSRFSQVQNANYSLFKQHLMQASSAIIPSVYYGFYSGKLRLSTV
jgi:hypothetical protein